MKHSLIYLILFLLPLRIFCQNPTITGHVYDKKTSEPLAFVNIVGNDGRGAVTDIDGKFSIVNGTNTRTLSISYVGYQPLIYQVNIGQDFQKILLEPKVFDLEEVSIFPNDNPAHRIINNVINNRDLNNPEKLKAFSYVAYDKMILTVNSDSLMSRDPALLDSVEMKARNLLTKQDLFITETVTERKYLAPGLNQENVLATKVSGFSDPIITFMISQIQSTSFYDEMIEIAGKKYINPISKGSTKKYFFLIEDTTFSATSDTIFIISYRPMKDTRFEGMKGFLSINSNRWAIQNVKAEPANDSTAGFSIKIQQGYEFIQDHWFPTQLNTDVSLPMITVSDSINNYPVIGKGRSYIREINLNPAIKKSDFGYHEIEIEAGATKRKGEFWREFRVDSLTDKEKETYRVIDSLGKAENFDKMASTFQTLLSGKIPFYFIDLDLNKIVHYNDYEGIYLGAGVHTNDRISKRIKTGLFAGYGFKDKEAKYGMDVSWMVHKRSESTIQLEAYNTVIASGETRFFDDKNQIWRTSDFYQFFVSRMNPTVGGELNYLFRLRPLRDFKWNTGVRHQQKKATSDYYFTNELLPLDEQLTDFNFSELSLGFRFAFREKILHTTKGQLSFGSKYPVVWVNYIRGLKVANGNFDFNRLDIKVEYTHKTKYYGESTIKVMSGIIDGQLPISNLYNAVGTYRMVALLAPGSFGTMRTNEFFSDRYVALFLNHSFGQLLFKTGKFKPEINLVTNITFGTMNHQQNHHNIDFKTLENGYYESGLVIRKLLNLQIYDLGIGVLYRYGSYGYIDAMDNIAFKISLYYGF
ncbi:MAG: hypothetical protein CO098_00490 [Bacteroidetes bacterium CG_4_9_14_3_um_filter_41_19]|nr:MAG: hypothetical protein CO098_00490 [Bacteroidetes bacterium CG_4_9_14_3_um_filter_41_19]